MARASDGRTEILVDIEGCARVSADGELIAVEQEAHVALFSAAGEHLRDLGGRALVRTVAWSPEGARFAQVRMPGTELDDAVLEVVDTQSGGRRPLYTGGRLVSALGESALTWRPTGDLWIALRGEGEVARGLYASGVDAWQPRRMDDADEFVSALSAGGPTLAALRLQHRAEVRVGGLTEQGLSSVFAIGSSSAPERGSQWARDGEGVWLTRRSDAGFRAVRQPLSGLPQPIPGAIARTWPQPFGEQVLVWELPDAPRGRPAIHRLDPRTGEGEEVWRVPDALTLGSAGRPDPPDWAFECRGGRCVIAGRQEGLILIGLDPTRGEVTWTRTVRAVTQPGTDIAVARTAERVAIADHERSEIAIVELDAETDAVRWIPLAEPCSPQYVEFGAEDAALWVTAYCFRPPTYRLFRVPLDGGEPIPELESDEEWLSHPIVSPDGRSLALTVSMYLANVWVLREER